MDGGAREQTMSEFWKKSQEAGVHVKQTEPHTPWSNAAKSAIRELIRDSDVKRYVLARQSDSGTTVWNAKHTFDPLQRTISID